MAECGSPLRASVAILAASRIRKLWSACGKPPKTTRKDRSLRTPDAARQADRDFAFTVADAVGFVVFRARAAGLARGLDIRDISHVINFEVPEIPEPLQPVKIPDLP